MITEDEMVNRMTPGIVTFAFKGSRAGISLGWPLEPFEKYKYTGSL